MNHRKNLAKISKLSKLRPIRKRERPFENRLRDALECERLLFVKSKPTRKGWPDRILIGFEKKRLVEIKREGADLSDAQVIVHRELWDRYRIRVIVIHNNMPIRDAVKYLQACLQDADEE